MGSAQVPGTGCAWPPRRHPAGHRPVAQGMTAAIDPFRSRTTAILDPTPSTGDPRVKKKSDVHRPSAAETKAATTNSTALQIIAHETAERLAKAKRQRAARLEREASQPVAVDKPKPLRKTAAKASAQ